MIKFDDLILALDIPNFGKIAHDNENIFLQRIGCEAVGLPSDLYPLYQFMRAQKSEIERLNTTLVTVRAEKDIALARSDSAEEFFSVEQAREKFKIMNEKKPKCSQCNDTGYEYGLDARDGPCRWCDLGKKEDVSSALVDAGVHKIVNTDTIVSIQETQEKLSQAKGMVGGDVCNHKPAQEVIDERQRQQDKEGAFGENTHKCLHCGKDCIVIAAESDENCIMTYCEACQSKIPRETLTSLGTQVKVSVDTIVRINEDLRKMNVKLNRRVLDLMSEKVASEGLIYELEKEREILRKRPSQNKELEDTPVQEKTCETLPCRQCGKDGVRPVGEDGTLICIECGDLYFIDNDEVVLPYRLLRGNTQHYDTKPTRGLWNRLLKSKK